MKSISPPLQERLRAALDLWIGVFDRHRILTNASAISFQALKSLVPLALFGIALPGVLGLSNVWDDQLKQVVARNFTSTAFVAIDTAVEKIMMEGNPVLPSFAGALLVWYVAGLVRACMGGMNSIYEADEERTLLRRWSLSFALALSVATAFVLSVLAITVGPRLDRSGAGHVLLLIVRWPFAVIVLGLAVGLLVRYGPAERRQARWASVGAVVVVAAWIVQSLLFAWYVRTFADFTSASGTLTVFLILAAYLYTASIIFLVGTEIDELLRKDASAGEKGILGVLLRGLSR
ncbi:MAG: YihY/virulence factor BrkB family protein [Gaiellaceae bacterium MAG52_C11]|nr:YihY/virulence factor BrkB family protein [Candidatus Gaiellasilicea maunaloa]